MIKTKDFVSKNTVKDSPQSARKMFPILDFYLEYNNSVIQRKNVKLCSCIGKTGWQFLQKLNLRAL